jgi:hypothetical protein
MNKQRLIDSLQSLHDDLADAPKLDVAELGSLRRLVDEIQDYLDRVDHEDEGPIPETPNANKSDQIREIIEHFETRHPQLTVLLSNLADRLADMGI